MVLLMLNIKYKLEEKYLQKKLYTFIFSILPNKHWSFDLKPEADGVYAGAGPGYEVWVFKILKAKVF